MDQNIYDQHRKHTSRVGAYAILKDGQHVASITIAWIRHRLRLRQAVRRYRIRRGGVSHGMGQ